MHDKKNTRADIISSAKKLFAKNGFAAVSMSQIAEDVGITKASLYYFFKDKRDIYFAVVEDLIIVINDVFEKGSRKVAGYDFSKTIEEAIRIGVLEGSAFMRLDAASMRINDVLDKKVQALFKNFFIKVEDFLKIYNIENPRLAAYVLLSSIHTYAKEACLRKSKASIKSYSQYLERLFLKTN